MSSRHCLRTSGEAAAARGLRSNSLAAASAPLLAACEGAFDGRPDSRWHATGAAAIGGCSTDTVAPGAGRREARGADDATPSVISTSSSLGLKTKTKIFDYREPFSRFYRDYGVNENENGYRKYGNENDIFIRN